MLSARASAQAAAFAADPDAALAKSAEDSAFILKDEFLGRSF